MQRHDDWDDRIARAGKLAREYPFAAEILKFYADVAGFQKILYRQAAAESAPLVQDSRPLQERLNLQLALQHLPTLLSLVEKHGPPGLAGAARELREQGQQHWLEMLNAGINGERGEPAHFFARAALQPLAEYLAYSSSLQLTNYSGPLCPLCSARPQAAVLRPEGDGAKRSLICSFCLLEWNFRRVVCPACGEQDKDKLPRYSAPDFPHLRIEACDSCKLYLKSVDLSVNGLAIPIVDEIAAAPLDLWAGERGYRKIESNLVNC